jgi:hypothetical protein
VTNRDADGQLITNPLTASFRVRDGREYIFVGFFLVPEGGLTRPRPGTGMNALTVYHGPLESIPNNSSLVALLRRPDNHAALCIQYTNSQWTIVSAGLPPRTTDGNGQTITDPRSAFVNNFVFENFYLVPDVPPDPQFALARTRRPPPQGAPALKR